MHGTFQEPKKQQKTNTDKSSLRVFGRRQQMVTQIPKMSVRVGLKEETFRES